MAEGDLFARYWRGDGPLWRLYWIWGVLVSTAGGTVLLLAAVYRMVSPWLILLTVLAGLVYTIWIVISTWRCAFNIAHRELFGIERETLGWMARVLTFAWAINAVGASLLLLEIAFGIVEL